MNLDFDLQQVQTTEFGVGCDDGDTETFSFVPVDVDVQNALREMSESTWNTMQELENTPAKYQPSEKYAGRDYVYLPVDDHFAQRMRELHRANNLPTDSNVLSKPHSVFCYFARLTGARGRRLTALRRATQFKGILQSRLIRLVSNALKLVDDNVFKLDVDFDLLVDDQNLHILRPGAFEFAGKLQSAILAAVSTNIGVLEQDLGFIDFSPIEKYAGQHPRAARYLASIRSQDEAKDIDKGALRRLCKSNGVEIHETNGKIIVEEGVVMDFLEVLDRRRYQVELVKGSPERFKAGSRSKLGN